jgi:hypothetical protein
MPAIRDARNQVGPKPGPRKLDDIRRRTAIAQNISPRRFVTLRELTGDPNNGVRDEVE